MNTPLLIRPTAPCRTVFGCRQGFALLITITLLAFLVLLAVSLAALTRVETQVAANTQEAAKARQNALMALQVALGELQRFAGPDQRITALADLVASTDTTGAMSPVASPQSVVAAARHWTGVWGNGQASIGYDLKPGGIDRRGVTPVLLNWLVSGNEQTAFSAVGTRGGVASGGAPLFTPEVALDISSGSTSAVLLVGAGSSGAGAADAVAAPLVPLNAPAGTVPGAAASDQPVVGRYAWWVGDEGVKARVNLRNGYQTTGVAADRLNSFALTQRAAPEFMDREVAGADSPTAIGTAYDFANSNVGSIVAVSQLALLNGALLNVPRNRFHDLTASSFGLLADAYAGGLKKDLTADIADMAPAGIYRPTDATPIFTPEAADELNLPTWGQMRSWARATPVVNTTTGDRELAPVPATDTQAAISPIVAYAALGFDAYIDADNVVHVALFPAVLLANPYPVTMAGARYDLGFKFPSGTLCRLDTAAPAAVLSWQTQATLDLGSWAVAAGSPAPSALPASDYVSFTIDGQAIPPGQTHLYRLDPGVSATNYAPGKLLTRAPESASAAPGLTNHVLLTSTFMLPATVDDSYFFRVQRFNFANAGNNYTRMETVLAKEGGLNDSASRYQLFNMITGPNPRGDIIRWPSDLTKPNDPGSAAAMKIGPGWRSYGGAREAGAALRLGFPQESQADYSSLGNFGMPQFTRHWLRHGNLRAPVGIPTRYETTDALIGSNKYDSRAGTVLAGSSIPNDTLSSRDVVLFPKTRGYATSQAGLYGTLDATTPLYRAIFFDVLDSPDRLLSLGQLQHAPFSSYIFSPLYPFGNSMADLRVPRTTTYVGGIVERQPGVATSRLDPAYDLSWHLNRALWDRYFVSGIPSTLAQADIAAGQSLPDARMTYVRRNGQEPALTDVRKTAAAGNPAYDRAAANLLVAGAFNINSTSEQAWRAVLGGTLGIPEDSAYAVSADKVDKIVPFARFSRGLTYPATGLWPAISTTMVLDNTNQNTTRGTFYHGNRGLWLNSPKTSTNTSASAVVNELARTLVQEVRRNGPFLSLADFVNRPVLSTKQARGIKGTLQAAIDAMSPAAAQANPIGITPIGTSTGRYSMWDREHFYGGELDTLGNYAGATGTDSFAFRQAFGSKYLTQADVLSTLGPQFTARSDTFRIRTYGEAVNPVTQNVEGRAWCEAVVQRMPDYMNDAQAPEAAASGENITYGRRFKIVSFRWLSASDL